MVLILLYPRGILVLVNIDKIPYVANNNTISERTTHRIAEVVQDYLTDIDAFYIEFFSGRSLAKSVIDIRAYLKPDILRDIQAGRHYLVLHNIHEAFYDIGKGIVEFCNHFDIPGEQVIVITGNHGLFESIDNISKRRNFTTPRVIACDVFEIQACNQLDFMMPEHLNRQRALRDWTKFHSFPERRTHRYLNLNRRWREHRVMLVSALIAHGLHTAGLVSLGMADDNQLPKMPEIITNSEYSWPSKHDIAEKIRSNLNNIIDTLPLYVDTEDLVTNRAMPELSDIDLYNSTGISVVSETTFFGDPGARDFAQPGVFLSEKAFKPIMHLHPWIMVSQPYTQSVMKFKGYETFSEFWDESYDFEFDDEHRMYMIFNLISNILDWPEDKFEWVMRTSNCICVNNIEVLYSKYTETHKYFRELS